VDKEKKFNKIETWPVVHLLCGCGRRCRRCCRRRGLGEGSSLTLSRRGPLGSTPAENRTQDGEQSRRNVAVAASRTWR
jgi:hypothetical protein